MYLSQYQRGWIIHALQGAVDHLCLSFLYFMIRADSAAVQLAAQVMYTSKQQPFWNGHKLVTDEQHIPCTHFLLPVTAGLL